MVAVLIVALALVACGEVQRTSYRPINDAGSYLTLASEIARTGDYSRAHRPGPAPAGPAARAPTSRPASRTSSAAVDLIDGHTTPRDGAIQPARLSQAVLGTITVALVGLVAFELFGELVGLIALVLAAVYPVLIELSGDARRREPADRAGPRGAVDAALRARARGAPTRAARGSPATGVLTGLATLTHENGVLILIPLIAAVWTAGRACRLARARRAGAAARHGRARRSCRGRSATRSSCTAFIPVSDETGITLVGTYNVASAADAHGPVQVADLLRRSPASAR